MLQLKIDPVLLIFFSKCVDKSLVIISGCCSNDTFSPSSSTLEAGGGWHMPAADCHPPPTFLPLSMGYPLKALGCSFRLICFSFCCLPISAQRAAKLFFPETRGKFSDVLFTSCADGTGKARWNLFERGKILTESEMFRFVFPCHQRGFIIQLFHHIQSLWHGLAYTKTSPATLDERLAVVFFHFPSLFLADLNADEHFLRSLKRSSKHLSGTVTRRNLEQFQ